MESEWFSSPRPATRSVPFSEETIFRVLRNKRRRYVLHYLKQRGGTVTVGDLAEQIAAWENDASVFDVAPDERKRVYISLLQSHLPTMAEANVVAFDEDRSEVSLTEDAADIDIYVELVPEKDIQWPEYYLWLAGFSGLFVVAAWVDIYPLTEPPPIAWLGFVVVLFGVSAVVHHLYHRRNRLGIEGAPPE